MINNTSLIIITQMKIKTKDPQGIKKMQISYKRRSKNSDQTSLGSLELQIL